MGLLFTILYIITAYLAPVTLFGDLAQYHIEIVIAVLALIFSIFSASGSNVLKLTQTWAIFGLCTAVACSMIFNGWIGGGPKMLMEFVPEVTTFFLIVMNCKKKWHLQVIAMTLFFCVCYIISCGMYDISQVPNGLQKSDYVLRQTIDADAVVREYVFRIRGRSFLGDPNDFAQFLVSLMPLMFLFWQKGSSVRNFLIVYIPCLIIFFGMYQTHSRGSMVALMAACVIAFRRKIGTVPAIIMGVAFFGALILGGFSGGRDVSAGEDRLAAWAAGLMLIRRHPVFGVGFQLFSDYNEITAHNTFVVCAAELGLFGVFCWVMVMLVTVRDVWETSKLPGEDEMSRQKKIDASYAKSPFLAGIPSLTEPSLASASGAAPIPVHASASVQAFSGAGMPFVLPPEPALDRSMELSADNFHQLPGFGEDAAAEDAEVRRMAQIMVVCFAGFLTAGWFLSRAYTMCLYVNAGMAAAVYRMARDRGIAPPPMPVGHAMKLTGLTVLALLIIVYVLVRVSHFMPS